MAFASVRAFVLSACFFVVLPVALAAQSVDKVRSDVLSALSTPLPITIVGPLLTRDVTVTEEGDGFRAVLGDTSLMGLFPLGDVSLHLTPLDDETYRVTELRFPERLDFPGMGVLEFAGMTLDGVWSSRSRSYSSLQWVTDDLRFRPGEGDRGQVSLGRLGFDVIKEPDGADTESRFEIAANAVAVTGMGPQNVALGEVRALLTANGEEPVDLYSVIREVLMSATMRNGGAQLQVLGQSLLGNRYGSVGLELSGRDLSAVDVRRPDESYFRAESVEVRAALSDVAPRNWGGAEVALRFAGLDQREAIPDVVMKVEEAMIRLSGGNLPVADMMAAAMTLANPPRGRPVAVSPLLDGLVGFGKLEIATEGRSVWVETYEQRFRDGQSTTEKAFETAFDRWGMSFGLAGFDRNAGEVHFATDLRGGRFVPGATIPDEALPHIAAWFPNVLQAQTRVSALNDGFLKRLFTDVEIRDLREPVELVLPLMLYVAATVPDVATGENTYETDLFRISQSGQYRFYPTEVLGLAPYEGDLRVRMSGMPGLLGYLDDTLTQVRPGSDEATAIGMAKSALIVLRNLAEDGGAGAHEWEVGRPDVTRREIEVNGITLRYPDFMQYMPMLFGMAAMRP
ncbi:hypothetical protein FLO80_10080 [Aquicoccus porphyridii]|uniref:DUF2125 domain-containing protein n=1 Tax=Aquicoccus porphyridii TaxID=1852029 RepID=A0A5A9ZGC5_9RHOB|nr:hypothetical protein FLO80_10080 [Aquicoccus porphyridii]RAI52709.1 hypothetical protein DOO74_16290 [Rhodobacteraceae bacterium AsT-22]